MISLAYKCRHISSLRSQARISWAPHHSLECTIGFSFSPWESISSVWCMTVHVNLLHVHVHVDRFYYKIHKFDPLMQFTVYIFLLTYRKRRDNCINFVLSLKLQCLIYTESFWDSNIHVYYISGNKCHKLKILFQLCFRLHLVISTTKQTTDYTYVLV